MTKVAQSKGLHRIIKVWSEDTPKIRSRGVFSPQGYPRLTFTYFTYKKAIICVLQT